MNRLKAWVPYYAYIPIVITFACNFLVYFPTKYLVDDLPQHDLTLWLDRALPFVPFFVLIYVLAYPQWLLSMCYHSRQDEETCYRLATGSVIAKLICMICFIAFPTSIVRPELTGNGFWEWGTGIVYGIDTPHNLFPSLHCLESWLCVRGALMMKKKSGWYITAQVIFSLLVFASTVLLKQHFAIDIVAGVLVGELGLWIAKKIGAGSVFSYINRKIFGKSRGEVNGKN